MKLPKFLMADNSEFPDDLFVVHTEYPRFILNVEEEEVEWLDDDWTVVTADSSLSAHYENTILITEGEAKILSLR